jgi:hypothetical protein
MRDVGQCEHCGKVGAPRLIDPLNLGRVFDVILCNDCFDDLIAGVEAIWSWFRQKYAD